MTLLGRQAADQEDHHHLHHRSADPPAGHVRNGEVDGTFDVSISDIDQWKALDNVDDHRAARSASISLTLRPEGSTLQRHPCVRRAIAHAVDRAGPWSGC